MAITRRQFVTRLSALAAAAGIGQLELGHLTEALAHEGAWASGNWTAKPKVLWVHGAECTGCSTSLLSFFEDVTGTVDKTANILSAKELATYQALDLAVGGPGDGSYLAGSATAAVLGVTKATPNSGAHAHPYGHRTLLEYGAATGTDEIDPDNAANATPLIANIADVLIDFIDLEYHETINSMGGDLAYKKLKDEMTGAGVPFVLVVEGAIQRNDQGGAWNAAQATGGAAWCSIGQDGAAGTEAAFDDVVSSLAGQATCVAVVGIGQCATFGGYPACKSPVFGASQTPAYGIGGFFKSYGTVGKDQLAAKCVNVPGCPTNPWWFILTVVALMIDLEAVTTATNFPATGPLGILSLSSATVSANTESALGTLQIVGGVDRTGRLSLVYPSAIHGPRCPNYQNYKNGVYASHPGDSGCLLNLGCKGPATKSLCPLHGWNSTNPHNSESFENGLTKKATAGGGLRTAPDGTKIGNFCISAGAPCMGCTEKGYPDAFVPFVVR